VRQREDASASFDVFLRRFEGGAPATADGEAVMSLLAPIVDTEPDGSGIDLYAGHAADHRLSYLLAAAAVVFLVLAVIGRRAPT
jgi:hypothetical protein